MKVKSIETVNCVSMKLLIKLIDIKICSRSDVFSASFILSIRIPFCLLRFFLIVINLKFLPVIVVEKLVLSRFEKGKTPLQHFLQL